MALEESLMKFKRRQIDASDNPDQHKSNFNYAKLQNVLAAPIVQPVTQKHQGCRLNDHGPSNEVLKRQRQGSSRSREGESSSSAFANSELVVLESPGEPSNLRSIRPQNSQAARSFHPIIDIDEFSPETRSNGSCNVDYSSRSASDSRDKQLEADEILAGELQEQLYNESNVAADHEIDEHVALALQQENLQHAFASRNRHVSHPRSSSMSNLHRENLSRSSQNSSTRRVTQPRVPTSTRMARLRGRFPGQPRTVSSRQRNVVFPPTMDVDTRMHILEALEAFNDMGMAGSLLQAQRDFNDYMDNLIGFVIADENNNPRYQILRRIGSWGPAFQFPVFECADIENAPPNRAVKLLPRTVGNELIWENSMHEINDVIDFFVNQPEQVTPLLLLDNHYTTLINEQEHLCIVFPYHVSIRHVLIDDQRFQRGLPIPCIRRIIRNIVVAIGGEFM